MLREALLEIIDHISPVGDFSAIRILGTPDATTIFAIDEQRRVIVQGESRNNISEFRGDFGFDRFTTLKQMLTFPSFKGDGAVITLNRKPSKDGDMDQPENIEFVSPDKASKASFRFLSASVLPARAIFKGTEWNFSFAPDAAKTKEMIDLSSMISNTIDLTGYRTESGKLILILGRDESSNTAAELVFHVGDPMKIKLDRNYYWPTSVVNNILRVNNGFGKSTISISKVGAMMVSRDSSFFKWNYILPERSK